MDQIWAEAAEAYRAGEELYLKDDLAKSASESQAEHTEESEKAGMVYEYLDTLLPGNWDSLDLGGRKMFLSGDFGEAVYAPWKSGANASVVTLSSSHMPKPGR